MKNKYFKITEKSTLDEIESCLVSSENKKKFLDKLTDDFGASYCLQYNGGDVAAFKFDKMPDRKVWKKVKHGFLPKVKTKENKLLCESPKVTSYKDVIRKYKFGDEMIIGEHTGRGFAMHSSYIKGNRKSGEYFIVAPFKGEFDREVHESLLEVKEWEMMKAIEEVSETNQ